MQNNDIDLNSKIREYMKIENELGLFKNVDLEDIYLKIKNIQIVKDNIFHVMDIIDGKNVIKINKKRCKGKENIF